MTPEKAAQAFAATVVDQLAASGVEHVCISPGSRSAPLAIAFARHGRFRVHVHVDERSGSFFALGLARESQRPVALLCTSGTAAAEFHPAIVEAFHARVPLVVLTADRPPELIDAGANQAIDQARLYGAAARWYHDPGVPEWSPDAPRRWRRLAARAVAETLGPPPGPVHLNLPFREPLSPPPGARPAAEGHPLPPPAAPAPPAPAGDDVDALRAALRDAGRRLVVAGELPPGPSLRAAVGRFCAATGAALFAEPSSGLRVEGLAGQVAAYEGLLRDPDFAAANRPEVVIRLGAAPTSRPVGEWLAASGARVFLVDPAGGWRDPDALAERRIRCDPAALLDELAVGPPSSWGASMAAAGDRAAAALRRSLDGAPLYEAHAVLALARALPAGSALMVGSSMAIRDVDTFWPAGRPGSVRFHGNRGASGIDGIVSTGLGVAAAHPGGRTAVLLGDLSLHHDMNGLVAARREGLEPVLVVLDNDGGGIFSFLAHAAHEDVFEDLFGTPLGLDLPAAGALYGFRARTVTAAGDLDAALAEAFAAPGPQMVVVRFRRRDSVAGHRAGWEAVRRSRSAAPGA